jgi:hypothetical protein
VGNVTPFKPLQAEVIEALQKALEDARNGEIDGIVLHVEYSNGAITSDWPGRFHPTNIVSFLAIAATHFASLALQEEYEDE